MHTLKEYSIWIAVGVGLILWGIYGVSVTPSATAYARRGAAAILLYPWVRIVAGLGMFAYVGYLYQQDKEIEKTVMSLDR